MSSFCAIDFGTTNSAVAVPGLSGMKLAEIEPGYRSLPTAVFYNAENNTRCFGRDAVAAYVDGLDGRLMRSIKSILGSDLMDRETEIGPNVAVRYIDVVVGFLRHLKEVAEAREQVELEHVILGRPVYFVDDDARRDAQAQDALEFAARAVGFKSVAFQFEPIAAALEFEAQVERERLVLVVDAGGGTTDFSVVRVGPSRREALDRRDDILANHGVHLAGTDFDQALSRKCIMPLLGMGALGPDGRQVPSSIYFDLSTWHLINTCYAVNRVVELQRMKWFYNEHVYHRRLMHVLRHRYGHELAAKTEDAKIKVGHHGTAIIDLHAVEPGLQLALGVVDLSEALGEKMERISQEAVTAVRMANLRAQDLDVLYFTGGSTKLEFLTRRIAGLFPTAQVVFGDPFASVVSGLGIYASRLFRS